MTARAKLDREWVVSELDEWGDIVDHSMHDTEAPARAEYDRRNAAGERVTLERWDTWWECDGMMRDREFFQIAESAPATEAFARGEALARAEGVQS